MGKTKTIGEAILQLRTQNHITRKDLCEGICSGKTLGRIENGEQSGNKWILEALLGRLGRTTTRMEYYLAKNDYVLQELRCKIQEAYYSGDISIIPDLLLEYTNHLKAKKPLHRQFIFKIKALLCKEDEGEQKAKFLEAALLCTVPRFYKIEIQALYLSEEEINLIAALSNVYQKTGKNIEAYQMRKKCFTYLRQERVDEELKLRSLPTLVLSIAEQAKTMCDKKTWKEVTDYTIRLLQRNRVLHTLPELMILRAEVMQSEAGEQEKQHYYVKELQYASMLKQIQVEFGKEEDVNSYKNSYFIEQSEYHFIGEDIRNRRVALHMNQKELTKNETICTLRQLTNIETGKSKPEELVYYKLMKELGVDESFYESYVDASNFSLDERRFQLERFLAQRKFTEAELIFYELSKELVETKASMQFRLYIQTILHVQLRQLSPLIALKQLEEALSYSIMNYTHQDLISWSLRRNEVRILNSIALMHAESGDLDSCIFLLYKLKKHYDNRRTTLPYHLKLYELVLRNLNKYLGLQGRYQEAIEIGNKGIQICMQSGNINLLPIFLYSKVWNIEKSQHNMQDICKHYMKQAYLLSYITNDIEKQHFMISFYQKQYHEILQIGDVIQ